MKQRSHAVLNQICEEDPRYQRAAYEFVLDALSFSQKRFRKIKHVSGRELLEGVKEMSIQQFGPMAKTVLKYWGIERTEDFGHIVFNLVARKVLTKTDDDTIDHFKDVYDFEVVFDKGYRKRLNRKISRLR